MANIDACSREPRALQLNYAFLPDGYGDTLVLTETLDEIMADKLVSLVNTTGYVRYRDIWDLRWLIQKGAKLRSDWLRQKTHDYRVDNYVDKVESMHQRLPEIIEGDVFYRELTRFIPREVSQRTLDKTKFREHLVREISQLLQDARDAMR